MQEIQMIAQKIRNKEALSEYEKAIRDDLKIIVGDQVLNQKVSPAPLLSEDKNQNNDEDIALRLMFSVKPDKNYKLPENVV